MESSFTEFLRSVVFQTSSILPKVSSWGLFLHSAVLCTNTRGCLPTLLAVGFGCVVTAKQVEFTLTPSHEWWERTLLPLHHSGHGRQYNRF